jgi:hypothetical protein
LNSLTDWVSRPDSRAWSSRLFFLVAIGGMGKSALTWHWFRHIAEQEMPGVQGRMWWSFYESDATFENFVIRALAYTTGQTIDQVQKIAPPERELWLLDRLDRSPHLIVLDGLERILLAYNRPDASRLADEDLDDATANQVAEAHGLPESAGQSFVGRHRLRMTTDPRAGQFLRRLTRVRSSRILVSTRLFPSDVQRADGFPIGNCWAHFLQGLSEIDAVDMWRRFGAKGPREELVKMFDTFDRHPLLIQTLASVVSRDRRANGDYETWLSNHPNFNPFDLLDAAERKSHILGHALTGIEDCELRLLRTIAAFRMPTMYDTLTALFVVASGGRQSPGIESSDSSPAAADVDSQRTDVLRSPFEAEPLLDAALADLEDRGLLGWDRRANRYDLHPIVRGVVFGSLTGSSRQDIYTTLHAHFEPIDTPEWLQVESLDDLTPAIELFNTLIELERYDDAFTVFRDRLSNATLWRLSASHLRVELAGRLFPDGVDEPPRLSQTLDQGFTLNVLALGYQFSGQPGATVPVLRRMAKAYKGDQRAVSVCLCNLSYSQRLSGDVRGAEASARTALQISRETNDEFNQGLSLYLLGLALAVRNSSFNANPGAPASEPIALASRPGEPSKSGTIGPDSSPAPGTVGSPASVAETALSRSLQLYQQQNNQQCVGLVSAHLAEAALWRGDLESARSLAARAWGLASVQRLEADFIRAARLQGTAECRLWLRESGVSFQLAKSGERKLEAYATYAHERLHHALTRARACQLVEEELPTLIALAELHVGKAKGGMVKAETDSAGREDDGVVGRSPDRLTVATEGLPSTSPLDFGTQDNNDGRPAVGHVTGSGDPATTTTGDPTTTSGREDDGLRRLEQAPRSSGSGLPESVPDSVPAGTARSLSQPTSDGNIVGAPEAAAMQTSLNATPAEHLAQARELLDDVWDRAEAGPYPLFHADALNMLAAIERLQADEPSLQTPGVDHRAAAIAAAQHGYEKAWLQGPPFAYAFGLANAQAHLDALGVEPPELPPYDESLYEPMPDVDIHPED